MIPKSPALRTFGALTAAILLTVLAFMLDSHTEKNLKESSTVSDTKDSRIVVTFARGTGRILPAAEALSGFADYFEARFPIRAKIRITPDPEEYQRRIAAGEFDIIHLAPFEYVQAAAAGAVEPIAVAVRADGTRFYQGVIVSRDESIRTVADLRGKRVTYVDEGSASGYLYPTALVLEAGIDPKRDFALFEPSGSHENVILNLNSGRYDAGFIRYVPEGEETGDRFDPEATKSADGFPVVAFTIPIPNGVFGFSKKFLTDQPELAATLRKEIIEMSANEEGRQATSLVFRGEGDRCEPAKDSDYIPVRRAVELLQKHGYSIE